METITQRFSAETAVFMSEKITTEAIRQDLSESEITQLSSSHAADMISLKKLNTNKKAYNKRVNAQIKELLTGADITLEYIEKRCIERTMQVFNIADDDRKVVEFYAAEDAGPFKKGDKVGERPQFDHERSNAFPK
jgi:iron uptake system EfeUOB component EfeO/EfeM